MKVGKQTIFTIMLENKQSMQFFMCECVCS